MSDDELAAVIAALDAFAAQSPEAAQPESKWKLEARREAVAYDVR